MAANEEDKDIQTDDINESDPGDSGAKKKKKKRAEGEGMGRPKDRNKRVREQAAQKMEEAKESAKSRANRIGATGLDTGEMVDDALARGFAAFLKWIKTNRRLLEFSVVGLILAGGGYAGWDWYSNKTREAASAALMLATVNASGVVEEKKDEPADPAEEAKMKDLDPRPRFESYQALHEEALRTYRVAADEHGGSGAGILARLGEAGVLLDRKDYDGAISALNAVLATNLAKADESVRMAAKERMGMAFEGKGDEAGANAAYAELAGSNLDTYKNLGLYHQARLSIDKGKNDEAKEKLDKLKERLKGKDSLKTTGGNRFLMTQVDALIRIVDPNAESLSPSIGAGGELTPEKLLELQKELERLRQNAPEMEAPAGEPTPAPTGETAPKEAPVVPAPATSGEGN